MARRFHIGAQVPEKKWTAGIAIALRIHPRVPRTLPRARLNPRRPTLARTPQLSGWGKGSHKGPQGEGGATIFPEGYYPLKQMTLFFLHP